MRFKPTKPLLSFFAIVGLAFMAQGCGLLGEKKPSKTQLTLEQGCFDQVGPSIVRFIDGEISESEWQGIWGCATQSLQLFRTYAVGVSSEGFSAAELKGFAETFLVTQQPVSLKMVQAFFELKASIFGGNKKFITKEEIDLAVQYVDALAKETSRLIPFMQARLKDPSLENLRALSKEMISVSQSLADRMPSVRTERFSVSSAQNLLDELQSLFEFKYPDHLAPFMMTIKSLLISGPNDSIDGVEWKKLLRSLSRVMGPLTAALSIPEGIRSQTDVYVSFLFELLQEAKPAIEDAVFSGRGAVSYRLINQLVEQAPKSWIQIDRSIIKEIVHVFIERILQAESSRGLDLPAVNTIYSLIGRWVRGQVFIEWFFKSENLTETSRISSSELSERLQKSGERNPQYKDIAKEMSALTEKVRSIFDESRSEITLKPSVGYGLFSLTRNYLFYLISEHLVRVYSTESDRKKVLAKDFRTFVDDLSEFLVAIKFTDRVREGDYLKRLREADFFTFASNADDAIDIYEATYYLQYLIATSNLSARIRALTESKCTIGKKDKIDWDYQGIHCFRKEFYANFDAITERMPGLSRYFKTISAPAKANIAYAIEYAGRRYGVNSLPIGNIDISGIAGTLYFIETVFLRFDSNADGLVDTQEALAAVPVFGSLIAQIGGLSPDNQSLIEAGFTFTLKKGKSPDKAPGGIAEFLSWVAMREIGGDSAWKLEVSRENLFGLLPVLIGPPLQIPEDEK